MNDELPELLKRLVEGWCDRRALSPLRCILAAYPMINGTSDEWHELYRALRNVRGLGDILTDPEQRDVEQALRLVDRSLRAVGRTP